MAASEPEFKIGDKVMFFQGVSITSGFPYLGEVIEMTERNGRKVYRVHAWHCYGRWGMTYRTVDKYGYELLHACGSTENGAATRKEIGSGTA